LEIRRPSAVEVEQRKPKRPLGGGGLGWAGGRGFKLNVADAQKSASFGNLIA